jgi:hypothetical protein
MPLIVKGTQDGRKVTGVMCTLDHRAVARYQSKREQCGPKTQLMQSWGIGGHSESQCVVGKGQELGA